jgi:hypothetical protein
MLKKTASEIKGSADDSGTDRRWEIHITQIYIKDD